MNILENDGRKAIRGRTADAKRTASFLKTATTRALPVLHGLAFIFCALQNVPIVHADDARTNQMERLVEMSPEELMNQEVTSVSKKPEKISESAAAISVLTQEDIKRSGAQSVPEALRLVPGLDVAQVDSQQWAVSARGFNDVFANKLLVMQDGRSLYTPLFSGVFWDVQNPMLEDIDRIEVIRGPGASLWGANAVNGVISIISKSAADTQGFLATASAGSYEQDSAAFRYGGKIAEDVYFRVGGHYFDRGDTATPDGENSHDEWRLAQGGFRIDWDTRNKGGDLLTLQGDIYGGNDNQVFGTYNPLNPTVANLTPDNERVGGGNLLGRWTHNFSEQNDLTLQAYYDRTDRRTVIFSENLDTADVSLQHHFILGDTHRNDIVWGAGYRLNDDRIGDTPSITLNPDKRDNQLFSAFAQDEFTIVPDRLRLTLGARLEHNDYTGFEFQPDGRLLWTPSDRQTVWGAVSRALRTPSEAEEFVQLAQTIPPGGAFPGSPALPAVLEGSRNMRSEELIAYQLGYRVEPLANLSVDFAAYYNDYNHLRSEEVVPGAGLPVQVDLVNQLHGNAYGFEIAPTWEALPGWRLQPSYSLLKMHLSGPDANTISMVEGGSPEQQFSLHSSTDLPHDLTFDWTLRYVDRLPALGVNSYVAADVRLAWRPGRHWELALVGQNLGGVRHAEYAPTFISTQRAEIREGGYAKITWHF